MKWGEKNNLSFLKNVRKILSGITSYCHLTHSSPNGKPLQKQYILLNDMIGVQRHSENAMLQLCIL